MTRINVVPVECLTDRHLLAEYRELPRIFTAVKELIENGKTPSDVDIPDSYKLGKGHVKFFYNKLTWLQHRFSLLYQELLIRGFDMDDGLYSAIFRGTFTIGSDLWWGEYTPTPRDIYLNMARLCKRSKLSTVLEELNNES